MSHESFEHWLQSRLTAHGFACGPIDGRVGDLTVAALKGFEKAHGLRVDGTADEIVVKALRAPASAISPAQMAAIPNRDDDTGEDAYAPMQTIWPRQSDVERFYGAVGERQVRVEIPFDMFLAWGNRQRITRMTLHRKVADSAARVLNRVADTYSAADRKALGIDQFGGSLNVRRMRGGSRYSMHSWGIAIDFDPARNALNTHKPAARLSHDDAIPFWEAWEDEGWLSLGRARDFDWMHVQAARL